MVHPFIAESGKAVTMGVWDRRRILESSRSNSFGEHAFTAFNGLLRTSSAVVVGQVRLSRLPATVILGVLTAASPLCQLPHARAAWPNDGDFMRVNASIERARSHHPEIEKELVWALIWQESKYDPLALGTKGEVGLGQLMPATAQALGVHDRTNVDESINAV